MSQPEMQPEGPARKEGGGATEQSPDEDDLTGRPFPLGDWGEPAERLDELYRWVEAGALHTADWYLADRARKRRAARVLRAGSADRARKRRAARVLRAGTAGGVIVGAALPLVDLAGAVDGAAGWGYLPLLLGAACLACDRYFGLTSGWMRDVAAAQAVQRRLQALQFDWA
ncbi:SLATT domain-containing protein, partial [Streptomyces chryseus]|uniref:SLATT domain-containing protein n=1 Tax=Streptomyces chryseus TaxID=68186 RepID=UPI001E32F8BF